MNSETHVISCLDVTFPSQHCRVDLQSPGSSIPTMFVGLDNRKCRRELLSGIFWVDIVSDNGPNDGGRLVATITMSNG